MVADVTNFIASIFSWIWAHHDQIGVTLTLVVLFWAGASKEKREALGAKLPRLAHLLDLFALIGMNVLEARRQIPLIKAGLPYVLPAALPEPTTPAPTIPAK